MINTSNLSSHFFPPSLLYWGRGEELRRKLNLHPKSRSLRNPSVISLIPEILVFYSKSTNPRVEKISTQWSQISKHFIPILYRNWRILVHLNSLHYTTSLRASSGTFLIINGNSPDLPDRWGLEFRSFQVITPSTPERHPWHRPLV